MSDRVNRSPDSDGRDPLEDVESPPAAGDPWELLLELALDADPHFSAQLSSIAQDLARQLAPQDAAETMLVTQMIATFSRSMFLSRHANRQKNPRWFALYSGECDRAMNLFRKQMQALGDYRRPRRTIFNAIRTANIAGQQVVLNDAPNPAGSPRRKSTHAPSQPATETKAQTALPTHPRRKGRPPGCDPQNQALET